MAKVRQAKAKKTPSAKALLAPASTATPSKKTCKAPLKALKKKPMTDPFTSRQVAMFYFTVVEDEDGAPTTTYICRCGCRRKLEPKTGYTNLLQHVFTWHATFISEMKKASTETGTLIGFIDNKTHKIFSWIDMVLKANLPFSFCESQSAEDYVSIGSLSTDTLVKYMRLLTSELEAVVTDILPKSFGIVFDGWTYRSEHYVAVFAAFRHDNKPQNILLAMAPLVDGDVDDHTADSHHKYLDTILGFFKRGTENVAYLVGDNCSVNVALSKRLCVPLVDCASHRLNLAVKLMLEDHETQLDKVQAVMCKLKNSLIIAAKLRRKTDLQPVLRQATRWSSTFSMVRRYFELRAHLEALADFEVAELMPTRREEKQLQGVLIQLKMFESTSKKLQSGENITLLDVRDLFDALIKNEPRVACYLGADADIVKHKTFENACVQVLLGDERGLSDEAKDMLEPLVVGASPLPTPQGQGVDGDTDGFAADVLKKARLARQATIGTTTLLLTSPRHLTSWNVFFSQAKGVIGLYRHALTPLNFEAILFLKVNRAYWDASTVRKVVRSEK